MRPGYEGMFVEHREHGPYRLGARRGDDRPAQDIPDDIEVPPALWRNLLLTAVGGQIDEGVELLVAQMGVLREHAIRSVQGPLLLSRQRRLEPGELIADLQHLEVLGTAHVRMLDLHDNDGRVGVLVPAVDEDFRRRGLHDTTDQRLVVATVASGECPSALRLATWWRAFPGFHRT